MRNLICLAVAAFVLVPVIASAAPGDRTGFVTSRKKFNEKDNYAEICQAEFGIKARVADWNDITAMFRRDPSMKGFKRDTGLNGMKNAALITYAGNKWGEGKSVYIIESRKNTPSPRSEGFVDEIGGHMFEVKLDKDNAKRVLCYIPQETQIDVGPAVGVNNSAQQAEIARMQAERARLEAEKADRARMEAERARLEAERAAIAKAEAEKAERARLEAERAKAAAERARIEAERAELERLRAEKARRDAEQARIEAERAERARLEAERAELERLRAEKARRDAEQARIEAERAERARLEAERAELARLRAEEAQRDAARHHGHHHGGGAAAAVAMAQAQAAQAEARRDPPPPPREPRLLSTSRMFREFHVLNNECRAEFGPGARVADWDDIKRMVRSGRDLDEFLRENGITGSSRDRLIYFDGKYKNARDRHYYLIYNERGVTPHGVTPIDRAHGNRLNAAAMMHLRTRVLCWVP